MKGKRYTMEEKIRILREEDSGKAIIDICREKNLSEVTFHRWKRQFGHLEVKEARRLKELERENGELKKMLADALLKNREQLWTQASPTAPRSAIALRDGKRLRRDEH